MPETDHRLGQSEPFTSITDTDTAAPNGFWFILQEPMGNVELDLVRIYQVWGSLGRQGDLAVLCVALTNHILPAASFSQSRSKR